MKIERRSFLQLMAGAVAAAGGASPAIAGLPAAPLANKPLTDWMLFRDHFVWILTEDLVIQPGRATNELLFRAPVPPSLLLHTVSWAWREDTKLADCWKLLGMGACEPTPASGMWLELMNDGQSVINAPASHFAAGFGARSTGSWYRASADRESMLPLREPIVPRGEFSLQVETPALDLSGPVALQFYLGGSIAIRDWGMGGVPVGPS